jgi:hypothetical protein
MGIIRLAVPWLLVASVQASAAEVQFVIWGGGTSVDEARSSLTSFETRLNTWKGRDGVGSEKDGDVFRFAPTFPRIIESSTAPGLNPGFHIVVLGVCADVEGAAVRALKSIAPSVYFRKGEWTGDVGCPSLGWPGEKAVVVSRTLKDKASRLTLTVFKTDSSGSTFWWAIASSYDAAGNALSDESFGWAPRSGGQSDCGGLVIEDGAAAFTLEGECMRPACTTPDVYRMKRVVRLKGGKVAVQDLDKRTSRGVCD